MFREGINLTKISLPVCLFEPRSFLERMTSNWVRGIHVLQLLNSLVSVADVAWTTPPPLLQEYLDLLTNAANSSDPVDRMKFVVAFACSGLCRQVSH
jgi:hypothetical protein